MYDPDNRNLLYNMGMALQELGQNTEAIECYDKVTSDPLNKLNVIKDQVVKTGFER
jgi:hypothetical protein